MHKNFGVTFENLASSKDFSQSRDQPTKSALRIPAEIMVGELVAEQRPVLLHRITIYNECPFSLT